MIKALNLESFLKFCKQKNFNLGNKGTTALKLLILLTGLFTEKLTLKLPTSETSARSGPEEFCPSLLVFYLKPKNSFVGTCRQSLNKTLSSAHTKVTLLC